VAVVSKSVKIYKHERCKKTRRVSSLLAPQLDRTYYETATQQYSNFQHEKLPMHRVLASTLHYPSA
jgi:hypothetical protein